MATTFTTLIARVRIQLTETTATFWTDAEIQSTLEDGARDLWRRLVDLYEHHFVTHDESSVSLTASSNVLTGTPADVYKIVSIEPRTLGDSSLTPGLIFSPKNWNSPEFKIARAEGTVPARMREILYAIFNAGAPVGAPTVRVAPQINAAVDLTMLYVPTLGTLTGASNNPIPGEADNALVAWGIAYSRAREREDRSPDPEWLAIYGTEKTNLIQQLAQRQLQEPETVEGQFDGWN